MPLPFFGRRRTLVVDSDSTRRRGGRPKGAKDTQPRRRRSRVEKAREDFLLNLQESDPALYRQIMMRQLALNGENQGPKTLKEQLAELAEFQELVQKLGGKTGGSDGSTALFEKLLDTELGKGLGIALGSKLGADAGRLLAAPPQPAGEPPATANATPNQASAEEIPLNLLERAMAQRICAYVIGELQDRAPADAAHWIRSQRDPNAQRIIQVINQTPNDQLLAVLNQSFGDPAYQPLVQFFMSRQDWTFAVADEVRQQTQKRSERAEKKTKTL